MPTRRSLPYSAIALVVLVAIALAGCGGGGGGTSQAEAQKSFRYFREKAQVVDNAVKGSASQSGHYLSDLEKAKRQFTAAWKKSPGYVHDIYGGYYRVTQKSLDSYIAGAHSIVKMRSVTPGDVVALKALLTRAIAQKEKGRRLFNRGVDRWNAALKEETKYVNGL